MVRPGVRREVVGVLQGAYQVSEQRACSAMGFGRSSQRYWSRRDPQAALRMRLKDLAAVRVRYGYRRLHVLLRREGWVVNHKRIHRLYAEEGLSIRTKLPRRKRAWRYRKGSPGAEAANEVWAKDFMSDQLFDGRPIRILTIVDIHTREGLSTTPRANFRAAQVVEVLDQLVRLRGKPRSLRVDNGLEFAGRLLDHWAHLNKVEIDFSRPGKPTDNAFIEAFNARLRAECLNASWFLSPADARARIEEWRQHYNEERPHSALGNLNPQGLCQPSWASPKSRVAPGPESGARPHHAELRFHPDHSMGAGHELAIPVQGCASILIVSNAFPCRSSTCPSRASSSPATRVLASAALALRSRSGSCAGTVGKKCPSSAPSGAWPSRALMRVMAWATLHRAGGWGT